MMMCVESMGEVEVTLLELEVAEQLIQLSGCDEEEEEEEGDEEEGSKNKSMHSTRTYKAEQEEVSRHMSLERRKEEEDKKDVEEDYWEGCNERRRPRFRSLASIYNETKPLGHEYEERSKKRVRDGSMKE